MADSRVLPTLVAVAALMLAVPGAHAAPALAPSMSIAIVDAPRPQARWGYAPATLAVAPGTWVTWSNAGQDAHTVTATDGSFDSGNLDPSQGFSWFFDQPGTYAYTCALHPWMTGTVLVGDPGAAPPAPDDATGDDASDGSDAQP